jgi:hypothetical protein
MNVIRFGTLSQGRVPVAGRDNRGLRALPGKLIALMGMAAGIALTSSASAHHSTANFDMTTVRTITGEVTYFGFTNPHSYIDLEVVEDGETRKVKVFTVAKLLMKRYGWVEGDCNPRDTVTVTGNPDRKNPAYLYLRKIVFASGKTWSRDTVPD